MAWERANATQQELARAEAHFLSVCDTDGEIDQDALDAAEAQVQQAAAEANEALNEIRVCGPGWAATFAKVLR